MNQEDIKRCQKLVSRHLNCLVFEKGQTDLTITKFMLILDEINIPIDEFMYAVHDFHRDDLNELLSKIRLFVSTHDIDGLKKLLNSQLESEPKREKVSSH